MAAPSSPRSGLGDSGFTPTSTPAPPLASDAQPLPLACACLNITIAALAADDLVTRIAAAPSQSSSEDDKPAVAPPSSSLTGRVQVWLPENTETVKHPMLATFEDDGDGSWRKCWVCSVQVYRVTSKHAGDIAPTDAWVDIELGNGVLYGSVLDAAQQRTPLPWSGLVLDAPADSTFGRPPQTSTPVPYPSVGNDSNVPLLPPIPDPFFLPPPFIPSHPALRDMCKGAVDALQVKQDEIERDIREYISQRAFDLRRIEDQVRAEVETLWDRFADGPGRGDITEGRRASVTMPRGSISVALSSTLASTHNPPPPPRQIPTTDLDSVSGVVPSPPAITGQFNHNTAIAAGVAATSSLLSASLSANAFYAPPPRTAQANINEFDNLTKTASHETGVEREVAMSYAFSAMADAAITSGRRRKSLEHAEVKLAEEAEVKAEDEQKGYDSWIGIERAQARSQAEQTAMEVKHSAAAAEQHGAVANGSKERKSRVTFQEPEKGAKAAAEEDPLDAKDEPQDIEDDDDYVFDMDTDAPPVSVEQPPVVAPVKPKLRSAFEDNLSQTFAAEIPSHRAGWRNAQGLSAALRREPREEEDDDDTPDSTSGMARSVPIHIAKPRIISSRPLERKTSLTDKEGHLVPGLITAMRERGVAPSQPRAIVGSVAHTAVRRGSRSVSGDRERDQVKSYAQDAGAMFESLAEGTVDSDSDEADDATPVPNGAKFVPPHVLAQRATKNDNVGWASLAS